MSHQESQPDPFTEGLPDFVEPLLGWRTWRVCDDPSNSDGCPFFSSVVLDVPWAPRRRAVAEHNFDLGSKCLGPVDRTCSCGIYAFNNPADAFMYLMNVRDRFLGSSVDVVVGTVSLWGRVIECERGYRAEYAYPHHFYLPVSFARFVGEVSSAFGVPTGIYASTKRDEITLTVSSGTRNRKKRMLHMKSAELFAAQRPADEFGFYDIEGGQLPFMEDTDFSLPGPDASDDPWV